MPLAPSPGFALRWRWLLPAALALLVFHLSPLRSVVDWGFFDFAARHPLRSPPPPDGAALVLFDQAAMAALSEQGLGTWPPPRVTFAAAVAALERAGAAHIVLDFEFLDHSAFAEQDALLGGLAAGLPNVILARTPRQMPAFWNESFVAEHVALFAAPRTGLAESVPDRDGVLRRYAFPDSLAAVAARLDVGRGLPNPPAPQAEPAEQSRRGRETPPYNDPSAQNSGAGTLLRWYGGLEQLRAHDDRVPLLSAASFVIAGLPLVERSLEQAPDFGPEPLAAALAAQPPLRGPAFDAVRGRVVFVGANAEGTFDQKRFAIGGLEPGVLFHWTAWANLVGAGHIREFPPWSALLAGTGLIFGLAAVGGHRSSVLVPLVVAVAIAGITAVGAYAGLSLGWFLPPASLFAATGLGLLGVVAEKFWTERQRKLHVQAMFGSYVAPEIVELLVRDPDAIALGGERREATVFFCDLAGFTDLSEQVSPEELLTVVNGYLEQTSECLLTHGAYVDKYIGDAVMAVFGAPKPLPDHALAACRAALAAQRLLAERNAALAAAHGRKLSLRVGVNTGEMIVGNVGSARKKNYTVLGDAVNLASRLEGANKAFDTRILIGETTARQVGARLVLRPLTALRVKGKQAAVPVFELIGEPDELSPDEEHFLEAYGRGHELYRTRRFAEAARALETARTLVPDDRMTARLLAESRRFAQRPPPADWLPIVSLDSK